MAALQRRGIVQTQHMAHLGFNSTTPPCRHPYRRSEIEMAYTEFFGALPRASAPQASGWLANLRSAITRRALYRRTVRELSALSNRELADLGLNPSIIERVAHESAYGN